MNEEEKTVVFIKHWLDDEEETFKATKKDVKVLLDLYNQEKEKNKKLEEENKYLQDYLDGMEGGLKEQIKEQSRVIAELEEQLQES